MLDVFLTAVIIDGLVVFYWRGLWELQTNLIYPDNAEYSALASVALGYIVFIPLLVLQSPIAKLSSTLDKKPFFYKVSCLYLLTLVFVRVLYY